MAPLLLTRAHCVATRFFGENGDIPVRLGGSFEATIDGRRLLGTVESFTRCSPDSLLARRAFDAELLALQDTEKEKKIAKYMKPFEIVDSNMEFEVRRQDVRSCIRILTSDLWTPAHEKTGTHFKVIAVLMEKVSRQEGSLEEEDGRTTREFHSLDPGTTHEM
jgi:hypothetical protein